MKKKDSAKTYAWLMFLSLISFMVSPALVVLIAQLFGINDNGQGIYVIGFVMIVSFASMIIFNFLCDLEEIANKAKEQEKASEPKVLHYKISTNHNAKP